MTTQMLLRLLLPVLLVLGAVFIAWARSKRPAPATPAPPPRPLGWLDDDGIVRGPRWDGGILRAAF